MIIDSITLENFRIFRGKHTIELTPESKEKPVILIGALNGAGKTSLLDALKLVLYGKFAPCSKKSKQSYQDFIIECINDQVKKENGCSIRLIFRTYLDGKEEKYSITRSWKIIGKKFQESFSVLVNDKQNSILENSWEEFVDSFIPVQLSSLFFFDGEKIEEFASPDSARELLAQGIHSLLGIDTIQQLEKDLDVIIKRKQTISHQTTERKNNLNKQWKNINDFEEKRAEANADYLNARDSLSELKNRLVHSEEKFKKMGGEIYQEKAQYENKIYSLQNELSELEKEAENFTAGVLPLTIVAETLASILSQAQIEENYQKYSQISKIVDSVKSQVINIMNESLSNEQLIVLRQAFAKTIKSVCSYSNQSDNYLGITSTITLDQLKNISKDIENENVRLEKLLSISYDLRMKLDSYQRKLENIPADDVIRPIMQEVEHLKKEVSTQQAKVEVLEEIYSKHNQAFMQAKKEFINLLEAGVDENITKQDDLRIIRRSQEIINLLEIFGEKILTKYINNIEQYITESFQTLIHKTSLVSQIKINPDTYDILLFDNAKHIISTDKLSAGERQLLGTSLLWGLAKAAARPLPAVVDTPLGRLDSSHRSNLIERYFPEASHQVILLSTDEEISGEYYKKLDPFISLSYTIKYEDDNRTSIVQKGYSFIN